ARLPFDAELLRLRVVLEQLRVAAPLSGDLELLGGLVLTEAATEDVPEEPGLQAPVGAALQACPDHPDQGHPVDGGPGEDPLRLLDVRPAEPDAFDREAHTGTFDLGEPEEHQSVSSSGSSTFSRRRLRAAA